MSLKSTIPHFPQSGDQENLDPDALVARGLSLLEEALALFDRASVSPEAGACLQGTIDQVRRLIKGGML